MRLTPFILLMLLGAALGVAYFWVDIAPPTAMRDNGIASEEAAHITVDRFALSNGIEVILLPSERVPAVSHMIWLRVGAADDPPGLSGLAHYHEHLMFKSTRNMPAGDYVRRLEALGGQFNAFTGADYTGYYVNIAREHLETVMQLESDRMQHLLPDPSVYATERDVIVEERQSRIGSNPDALFDEQMQAAMFLHHPYRIPVIGWMEEIKGLTPEAAQDFYRNHYHSGNMVLVVAGDVTREQLEPLAERYYGTIPTRPRPARNWVKEPPHLAARRLVMTHEEVTQPRFQRRYLAPSYGEAEIASVLETSLLAEWLGGSDTSLLYESLVKEQRVAASVVAYFSGMNRGPAQLVIEAVPLAGVSPEQLEEAIDALLARAQSELIPEGDLSRIKTQYIASAVYARDGLQPLAQFAGYLAMLDLPMRLLTHWQEYVSPISVEALQQAARQVLTRPQSVTGYLLPQDKPDLPMPEVYDAS